MRVLKLWVVAAGPGKAYGMFFFFIIWNYLKC